MAVYKLFPIQDSTIYFSNPDMNSGMDAILEISNIKDTYGNIDVRRTLIKFDSSELINVLSNIPSSSYSAFLKLHNSEAKNITGTFNIEAFPVSGSWRNGTGLAFNSPITTDGVSWNYIKGDKNDSWIIENFPQYVTASFNSLYPGGGNWYAGSEHSELNITPTQLFDLRSNFDINLDVTDIVKLWTTGSNSIPNEGIILKLDPNIEFNLSSSYQPQLNYYSIDTNTIYPPALEIKWDDSLYVTGSLLQVSNNDVVIGVSNVKPIFYNDEINKFKINVRPKYPIRTYQTSSIYSNNYRLPSSSYYAVMDIDNGDYVIDFDEQYTKISCDENGNYFNFNMNGLEPERNYCILVKTVIEDNTIIKGDNNIFKIKNG